MMSYLLNPIHIGARVSLPAMFLAPFLSLAVLAGGCASTKATTAMPARPDVAPKGESRASEVLQLDGSDIEPMYTEMLAIDLGTVARVAVAGNLAVLEARRRVEASQGDLESRVGAAFPALVPTALFEKVQGSVRATEGNIVGVGFNTFQPSIAIQWVINPGRVIYDIIAAKKRLAAAEHQERAVVLETLRLGAVQYYELVLNQARVSAAHEGVLEAEELLRINRLRTRTGSGVPADELRAEARLAQRRQELVVAVKEFYDASVALAVTLHLDSSVTLVPRIDELPPANLVRADLSIDELLAFAATFRPDLEEVRMLVEASTADKGATWWGALGPQFQLAYQYGGITGHADNFAQADGIPSNLILNPASPNGSLSSNPVVDGLVKEGILRGSRKRAGRVDQTFSFSDQRRTTAGVGWKFSLSVFGDLKKANATRERALLEGRRRLDRVRAQVVTAAQASRANQELIELSDQQVKSAAEALRLTEANLRAGAMTTLDVLQAQDAANQARLRQAEAVVRYNQSQVDLLAALGLIDVQALSSASSLADSEANSIAPDPK